MNILKVTVWLLLITNSWHCAFMWDKEFLLHYILPFIRVTKVQEVYWFITEYLDIQHSETFEDFFNVIHQKITASHMILTSNSETKITHSSSSRKHIGVVMTSGALDPIMELHNRILEGRHFLANFIVLVKPLEDFAEAEQLLRWLHNNRFVNSILYVQYTNQSSDLLGVTRCPQFAFHSCNKLLEDLDENYMRSLRRLNCHGNEFYTPIHLDFPDVFSFINNENLTEKHGTALEVLKLFTKQINVSLESYKTPATKSTDTVANMQDILQLVRAKEIFVAAHAYALFNPDEEIDKSSALSLVKWCLMVPIRSETSFIYYPIISYETPVWWAILFTYLALVITDCCWLWWESQKDKQQKFKVQQQIPSSITHNLCCLLFIATWKHIRRPSLIRFLLYATVFFHAFFISTGYSSILGSILTVSLFSHQINTMEDLIKAQLPTMIIDYELEFLLKLQLDLPKDFLNLIVAVDAPTFHAHRTSFDQSYAYFVCEHQWRFLRKQQVNLKPQLFKFTDICFGTFSLGFPMEIDSPVKHYMEYFFSAVQASGLNKYFAETAFGHAIRAGYVQHFKPDNNYQASGLSQVSMVFYILIVSNCLCIMVFLCEYLYYRLKVKSKNYKRK